LDDLVDARRSPAGDPEITAHACACAACERLLRDYESMLTGIAALRPLEHPAHLAERVIAENAWTFRRRFSRRTVAALALAATVLLAALPAIEWLRSSAQPPVQPAAHMAAVAAATDGNVATTAHEPQEALVDQVRETYQPLVDATSESLTSMLAALPLGNTAPLGMVTPQDSATARVADESSTASRAPWQGEFASGMGPVAASASRSVVALLRVFPSGSHPVADHGATP
jgi:hypothetical protein